MAARGYKKYNYTRAMSKRQARQGAKYWRRKGYRAKSVSVSKSKSRVLFWRK